MKNKQASLRPTSSYVLEGIFNTIQFQQNKKFLDLFAGTGSFGHKALEYNPHLITLVDISNFSTKLLYKNFSNNQQSEVFKQDYLTFLHRNKTIYDYVFIDPPYKETKYYWNSLSLLLEKDLIDDDSIIIVESSKHFYYKVPIGLHLFKQKKYGDTIVSYFNKTSKIVLIPGSFDPFHEGHFQLGEIAQKKHNFEQVVYLIANNPNKNTVLNLEERYVLTELLLNSYLNINVAKTEGLTADFMKKWEIKSILRGYTNEKMYDYEMALKDEYLKANPNANFLIEKTDLNVSSSLIKQALINKEKLFKNSFSSSYQSLVSKEYLKRL